MTLDTSEFSVLSMLSDSPIRCVTGLCGLSLNYHKDRKVSLSCVAYIASILSLFIYPDYRIVIICSNEDESKSRVISKLQFYQRPYSTLQSDITFAEYLLRHFKRWPEYAYKKGLSGAGVASAVDPDK